MKKSLLALLLVAAGVSSLAASAGGGHTTVAEEDCVAGPDQQEAASPDWVDLCTLSFAAVGDVLEVRLTTVGSPADRPAPATYQAGWTVGGCGVTVHSSDYLDGSRHDELTAVCDDIPGIINGDVPPPSFTGDAVTWSLRFDGPLAELAPVHASGATLVEAVGAAANSVSIEVGDAFVRSGVLAPEVCVAPVGCTSPVDDRLDADRDFRIP